MQNKESYLHRMAKELLYSQIVETGRFPTKDANGIRVGEHPDLTHIMHQRVLDGEFNDPQDVEFQGIKKRYGDIELIMEYVINEDLYDCTVCEYEDDTTRACDHSKAKDGYDPCSACPHANLDATIIHDIAMIAHGYYDHILYAVEIIHKHYPRWEGEVFRPYPTYLIRADSVVRRVANTPVYIERVI